jgi:RNA polymerase sigma-70 factor (ECF subfamily)
VRKPTCNGPAPQTLKDTGTMSVPDNVLQAQERVTILLAQQGNREAFSSLIDLYDQRLLYFVRRILGETDGALDILQSVWLTVHRKLGGLKSIDAFRVWLYRVAHDHAVTELRRKSRRPISVEEIASDAIEEDLNIRESAFENAELVHIGMQTLSVDHRRVLTLRFLEDMTIEEIAEVIGSTAGTVKSRLHYAKAALRRRIEELAIE